MVSDPDRRGVPRKARDVPAASASGTPAPRGSLAIDGVEKSYGGRRVLEPLQLDIAPGEFFSILGPSGSGKTTTLMLIAGFAEADEGDILLDGVSIGSRPPARRNIGVVFQNYALFPHLRVFDNVGFALKVRGVSSKEIRDRVHAALALVGLEGYEERLPSQLSGGQQQRVALARAIIFKPALLLMDEPLGALDRKLRLQLQVELRRLQRELNVTIVYVTHDQEEAMSMSDRIAILSEGRLQQVGTPRDIYEAPANEYVATFIGDSNILDAHCVATDSSTIDVRLAGTLPMLLAQPGGVGAGDVVPVLARPEAVSVSTDLTGCSAEWTATVEEIMYLGDQAKCVLQFADGPRLIARVAGHRGADLCSGRRVAVSIERSAVRLFASSVAVNGAASLPAEELPVGN